MAISIGSDEGGAAAIDDVPDAEPQKYTLSLKPLTDEVRSRLFPGMDSLTIADTDGVVRAGHMSGDVQSYSEMCWY